MKKGGFLKIFMVACFLISHSVHAGIITSAIKLGLAYGGYQFAKGAAIGYSKQNESFIKEAEGVIRKVATDTKDALVSLGKKVEEYGKQLGRSSQLKDAIKDTHKKIDEGTKTS